MGLSQEHFLRYEAADDANLRRIVVDVETFNPWEKLKTCIENTGPFPVLRNVSPTQPCIGKAISTVLYISRLLMLMLKNSHCCGSLTESASQYLREIPCCMTTPVLVWPGTINDRLCSVFLESVGPFAIPPTRAA